MVVVAPEMGVEFKLSVTCPPSENVDVVGVGDVALFPPPHAETHTVRATNARTPLMEILAIGSVELWTRGPSDTSLVVPIFRGVLSL